MTRFDPIIPLLIGKTRDRSPSCEHIPGRPRRGRPFRHFWRPICCRNLDAADPGGRSAPMPPPRSTPSLQGRSSLPLRQALHRPAVSRSTLAERLTGEAGRRQDLLQARRAQPYRQPQDQQLPGPDPAGPAHGQDADHRRDRAPASTASPWPPSAPSSACPAWSTWARRRHRPPAAQRVPHEAAGRRGQGPSRPAAAPSRMP